MAREEFELYIDQTQYHKLQGKLDYPLLKKTRYLIPYETYTIELDIFHENFEGLFLAEVEFESIDEANGFTPPTWFGEDVSHSKQYQNSRLCQLNSIKDI